VASRWPPAVVLGRVHELLDLGLRQVFPSAKVAVGAARGNCSFYGIRQAERAKDVVKPFSLESPSPAAGPRIRVSDY
jgi:hypothetical protein